MIRERPISFEKVASFVIAIFLLSLLAINTCNASETHENLPKGVTLKNESFYWLSTSTIFTPYGNKTQIEQIGYVYVPKDGEFPAAHSSNITGKLASDIELYIDGNKENFSEYFLDHASNNNIWIEPIKPIILKKSSEIKLKFVVTGYTFSYANNNAILNSDFYLFKNQLFVKYIFRLPTVSAHNLNVDFLSSVLILPDGDIRPIPASTVRATDEYLEITYVFWNDDLVNQILELDEGSNVLNRVIPETIFRFNTKFFIEYETLKIGWLILAVLSSLLATFAFYGGYTWGKRQKR